MVALALGLMIAAPRAALLLGVTGADTSPTQDCALVRGALLQSGWKPSEIEVKTGALTVDEVRQALSSVAGRGRGGSIIVLISGTATPTQAGPVLDVAGEPDPTLQSLLAPLGTGESEVTVLFDTGYSNLMYGRIPQGVSALVVEGTWNTRAIGRRVGTFVHNGVEIRAGVLSYVLAREIPYAADLRDLAYRVGKYKDSGSMAAIWADLPRADVIRGRADKPSDTLRK